MSWVSSGRDKGWYERMMQENCSYCFPVKLAALLLPFTSFCHILGYAIQNSMIIWIKNQVHFQFTVAFIIYFMFLQSFIIVLRNVDKIKMNIFKLKFLRIVNNNKKTFCTTENQLLIIGMTGVCHCPNHIN